MHGFQPRLARMEDGGISDTGIGICICIYFKALSCFCCCYAYNLSTDHMAQ